MNKFSIRQTTLASITMLSLLALPMQAHAFDARTIPLIGGLINMMFPVAKPAVRPPVQQQVPIQVYNPQTGGTTTVWTIPQPSASYTYVNTQAQRVYNVYNPQTQVRPYSVPSNFPVLQHTNPQLAQQIQNQVGIAQPAQTDQSQWQYQVSPVAYQQTSPVAPQLSGVNMAANNTASDTGSRYINSNSSSPRSGADLNGTGSLSAATSTSTPTSLTDTRVLDTNTTGTYKWPVPTNAKGTTGYVSSTFGDRDRDNFVKGCSDGTAPASHCGIKKHNGIDLAVPHGTNIESMSSGKVVRVDPYCNNPDSKLAFNKDPTKVSARGGCTVSVMNDSGEVITYQHLSDPGGLKAGDSIAAGDSIGKSGNSGGSFGAHLDVSICQSTVDKVNAASAAKKDVSRCEANGGKLVNPLDKMDPKDPRAASARAREKANKDYLDCKKKAGKDFDALQTCKNTFNSKKSAKGKTAKKGDANFVPQTGKLNMGRI